jgi:hypothetical protein
MLDELELEMLVHFNAMSQTKVAILESPLKEWAGKQNHKE